MKRRPYWLVGGTETCELCRQAYVVEMEYRCPRCDGGFCVHCVVLVDEAEEWFCGECSVSEETC